jgi:hypothetical protein
MVLADNDRVIGPFFFDEDILDMLENHVLPQLKNNNHNITDLLKALLGNGSVNTFQHATINEAAFYVFRAMPNAGNGPMNSQSYT